MAFAAILMYHEQIIEKHTENHSLVVTLERDAKGLGISRAMLIAWGTTIKDDVILNSARMTSSNIDHEVLIGPVTTAATQAKRDHVVVLNELKFKKKKIVS